MIRILFILAIAILLGGCDTSKPITVHLHATDNNEQQLVGVTFYISENIEPDSTLLSLAKKLNLSSFIVSEYDHAPQRGQAMEKKENIPDSKTIFLAGFNNDSILVIADANNNNRLDDDKIISLNRKVLYSQTKVDLDKLPFVHIQNLQTVYNGRNYTFSKKLFFSPDTIRTGKLTVTVISNEQSIGRFRYRGKKYYVRARQFSPGHFINDPKFANIRLDKGRNTSALKFDSKAIVHLYNEVKLGENIFTIQKVDSFLNFIVLKPVSLNEPLKISDTHENFIH